MTNTVCTLRRFAIGCVTATLGTLEQIKAYFTMLGCAALFVGVVASFTNPTPAVAQESRSATIEEVIVTARKRQEAAQDVPIAITAITRELQSATIRNLQDLNGFAPNVQIVEDGSRGGGGASINIRGISPTRTDDNSFDSPVAVMIDGIYLGSLAGQVIENFDLERIEVLRGPQGTLFGKNTVGGVINVIRTRPTGEFGGRLKATFGEDGQQEFRAVLNAPIMEDVLAVKVFGTYQEDDGYYDNVTTGDHFGDTEYKNYGLTLLWTPNDTFEATLTAEKFDDDSKLNAYHTNYNLLPGLLPPSTDPNETDYSGGHLSCALSGVFTPEPECRTSLSTPGNAEGDTNNDAHLETDAYTLNMSYDLNDFMTLVSVTGYRDMDEYRIFDFDGSAFPFITIERWNDYEQWSQELRIDGSFDNGVSFTGGTYYFRSKFEQDWVTGGSFWGILIPATSDPVGWADCQAGGIAPVFCDTGIPNPPGFETTQILFEKQETTSYAFFAQVDWEFIEDWTVTAGLRWTEERKDFRAGQAYLSDIERQRLRNFPEYADLDNTWRETSPKLGLTYRLNDSAMAYVTYSEGFHSGGFFGVNQNTRDFIRDQYDPETSENYEIGYKSVMFDNTLKFNVAVFYNEFKDKQEQSIQADPDTNTVATTFSNAASATYWGIEIETEYVFNQYVRAFLNYGYLDAEYDDFETDINANDGLDIVEDASFLTPRRAPENTIGVGGTITIPLGPGVIEIYSKYSWIDEQETTLLNTPLGLVDSVEDLTASIGYFGENYSIVAFGRNLTDDQVETFFSIDAPGLPLFAVGTVNRPRAYGVELSYNF